MWRMTNTKDLNYPLTSARVNQYWSTYRLRCLEAPERGYWDEYTDVMKDSYGIGHNFVGLYALMNKMPDLALWSYNNALRYRQPQTLGSIYLMLGETYLALRSPTPAIANYSEVLKRDPKNAYCYAKIGNAFVMMNVLAEAEKAFQTSLSLNPNQQEAVSGLQDLRKLQGQGEAGKKN
jgi:tetratricopeptide (TPR) repeat protein